MYIRGLNICTSHLGMQKHGAVSHSSNEAEVIALDGALRLEGLPALQGSSLAKALML